MVQPHLKGRRRTVSWRRRTREQIMSTDKKTEPSGQEPKKPATNPSAKKRQADQPLTDAELAKAAGGGEQRPKVGWD
jgi:hypothetical protein